MQENRVGFLRIFFSARRTKCCYSQACPQSRTQPAVVSQHNFQSWSAAAMGRPANGSHTPTIQLLQSSHPHFLQHNRIVASCPGQCHTFTRSNFLAILTTYHYWSPGEPLIALQRLSSGMSFTHFYPKAHTRSS